MENITIFGDGYMDETVDMFYYSRNDFTNPKYLGNVFPFIGRDAVEKFYEYGIMGESKEDDFVFLQKLNVFRESYEILSIIPLTTYTILVEYWFKGKKYIGYFGLDGCYKKYLNQLMNGIKKIDLSKNDFNDVLKFDSSNAKKILTTKKIKVVNLNSNQKKLCIKEENIINYLLHILPQYLPNNVKLKSSVFDVINYDKDDISFEFRNLLWDKAQQYIKKIRTKN